MAPTENRYLKSHEWARKDGELLLVGITDFAVKHLSDLVFLDLPTAATEVRQGEAFGEIESVKAVSELLSPVTGTIVEVNEELADRLDDLSADPYGKGWMIKVRAEGDGGLGELLSAAEYDAYAAEEEG
ncbi:MAG: glycine cleavage system protein GcvH [Planctomycetota bacterium]